MDETMSKNQIPSTNKGRFFTMPDSYLPKDKRRLSPFLIGLITIIALIVLGAAGLIFYFNQQNQMTPAPIVVNEEPATETTPSDEATPATPETTPATPEPPTQPALAIKFDFSQVGKIPLSQDLDKDGLTDEEEALFKTQVSVPDTDSDSYLDGSEVLNLYDPAKPAALLDLSAQVKIGQNEKFGYQFLLPTNWTTVKETANSEVLLIKPLEGDQSMSITVYENAKQLSVAQWVREQIANSSLSQFINFSNEAGFTGVQTTDHLFVVATLDDGGPGARALMIVLAYDPGTSLTIDYPIVWQMIANSLAVLEPAL